jgi:hypothetical protein
MNCPRPGPARLEPRWGAWWSRGWAPLERSSALKPGEATRIVVAALLFTVAWHLAWFTWFTVAPPPSPAVAVDAASYRYLGISTLDRESRLALKAMQRVRSPALFSLPSPHGFSRQLYQKEFSLRPPLEAAGDDALYRLRPEPSADSTRRTIRSSTPSIGAGELRDADHLAPVFADATRSATSLYWRLEGGLENRAVLRASLPPEWSGALSNLWEVTARLGVDEYGSVQHVGMESTTLGPVHRAQIARQLWRWRFDATGQPADGLLTLRAFGAPPPNPENAP